MNEIIQEFLPHWAKMNPTELERDVEEAIKDGLNLFLSEVDEISGDDGSSIKLATEFKVAALNGAIKGLTSVRDGLK